MTIEVVCRSRRYDMLEPTDPSPANASAAKPRHKAPELEHPIRYPAEMFAGSAYAKKPGAFERAARHTREPHVVERSFASKFEYPQTVLASRSNEGARGRIYTGSPNEVQTRTTTPTPRGGCLDA
jgi:hypothetical protein